MTKANQPQRTRDSEFEDLVKSPENRDLKETAIRSGGASVLAQTLSFGIRMGEVVVLARLLQPGDFGVVAMVSFVYLMLMNFGINGFTEYIIQKEELTHRELSTIFWLHGLISVCTMALFMATAPLLSAFYKEPAVKSVAIVMSLGIVIQMLSTHHLALLKRNMEFRKIAANSVIANAASVAVGVAMAFLGLRYWAIVARQASYLIMVCIGAWIMCRWRPGLPEKFSTAVGALKFALQVYGNFLLQYVSRNLDKFLIGRFHGSAVLGNYDRAAHLKSVPAGQVVTPLHSVGIATLSRLRQSPERYSRYYRKALSTLSFVGVFASLLLTLAGRELIFVLLGGGWEQAGAVATVFGPGIGPMILLSTCNWLHLSLGRPDRWLRWSLASLGVVAVLLVVSARFGPVYVAGAYTLSYYSLLVPAIAYGGRPIGVRVGPIIKRIGPHFLSALIVAAVWVGGTSLFAGIARFVEDLHALSRLFLVLSFCSVTYFPITFIFHKGTEPLRELWDFARVALRRRTLH